MAVVPASPRPRHAWTRSTLAVVGVVVAVAAGAGAVVALRGSGTTVGSGVPAESVREVPPFSAVELAATNDLTIRVGRPQRVVVHGDSNLLPLVTTHVVDGRLVVGARHGFKTTRAMRVVVSVPSLDSIALDGGGVVRASGSVPRLAARLEGTGYLKLARLVARDVQATLDGTGRIDVTATRSLTATVSGTGAIVYRGNPTAVEKSVRGNGVVQPG